MKEFQVAPVGCGLFGESHLSALQAVPGLRVTAVYDVDSAGAAALAATYQVPVAATSLDALLTGPVDVVHVAAPEDCHREPVVAALQAGKDVRIEKPFATSIADCDAMAEAARVSGRTLIVGHRLRFDPRRPHRKDRLHEREARAHARRVSHVRTKPYGAVQLRA